MSDADQPIRAAMTNFVINWGLYFVLILAMALVAALAFLTRHYHLAIIPFPPYALVAAKITFLSIILALGMFQYRYFYDETTHLQERAQRGDYGPGWAEYGRQAEEARQLMQTHEQHLAKAEERVAAARQTITKHPSPQEADTLRRYEESVTTTARSLDQIRDTLRKMDDAIQRTRGEFRAIVRLNLLDFNIRLSLIFATGLLVFTSLSLDLIPLIWTNLSAASFALYSQSSLLGSLGLLFVLFCLFLAVVQAQFRRHNKES